MAEIIRMPKMSDTMTEGVIVSWLKQVGDDIKPGDILAEVETDKATMELENFVKGTLIHIGIPVGGSVPVDAIIAIVGAKGEDISAVLNADNKKEETTASKIEDPITPAATVNNNATQLSSNERIKASPLAKKIAEDKGISLIQIHGSGDGGRIIKRDIESYIPLQNNLESKVVLSASSKENVLPQIVAHESFDDVQLSQMRKVIARRLSESMYTAPHFYLTMNIRMDKAIEARKIINEGADIKMSMNDIIVKAVATALRKNPNVNVSWLGDKIRYNHHINIGIAVAIEDGLIVPVVKFADNKSISHISAEIKQLADKAKNKKLQPNEFEGSTFTISNLGMFGIEQFTAIINPPDACILAVGAALDTVLVENGQMKVGSLMKVTLSCDHRAVDGAVGSAFLKTLKELLENPVKMMV